jgi:ubiquitin thioesterase protein OTUB1
MTSLSNMLTTIGDFESWLFEDMVQETTNLLRDLAGSLQTSLGTAMELLMQRFNDREISDPIVYHFRLLASSWLKGYPASYQDFIPDNLGVDGYRKEWLEAPNQEIDHLGMTLLIDALLKPIGFAVEIVYLDRSEGSQVNSHLIQAEDSNGVPTNPTGPIIHLLYRPSHYDILYQNMGASITLQQVVDEAAQNQHIQVNRATSFTQQHTIQGTLISNFSGIDLTSLLSIPGIEPGHLPSHHRIPAQYQSPIEQPYSSSPISAPISPILMSSSSTTTSSNNDLSLPTNFSPRSPPTLTASTHTPQHFSHATFPPTTTQLPIHPLSHPGVPQRHASPPPNRPALSSHSSEVSSPTSTTSSFRPSRWEWEAKAAGDWQDISAALQTSTFKNSHYNRAHFNNPNFQPEEWNPEYD